MKARSAPRCTAWKRKGARVRPRESYRVSLCRLRSRFNKTLISQFLYSTLRARYRDAGFMPSIGYNFDTRMTCAIASHTNRTRHPFARASHQHAQGLHTNSEISGNERCGYRPSKNADCVIIVKRRYTAISLDVQRATIESGQRSKTPRLPSAAIEFGHLQLQKPRSKW